MLYLGQMAAQVERSDVNQQQLVELITTGRTRGTGSPEGAPRTASTSVTSLTKHDGDDRRRPTHDRPPATTALAADRHSTAAAEAHRADRTQPRHTGVYFRLYVQRVRGGDMGSLPAVGGLIVLVILFSLSSPRSAASTTSATCSPRAPARSCSPWAWSSSCCSARSTCRPATPAGVCAAVMARLMVGYNCAWPVTIGAALVTGVIIGVLIGLLRAKVRIPSFVVTLALFLAFQGVTLYIVNNGKGQHGDIRITDTLVLAFENSPDAGVGGLAARHRARGRLRRSSSCRHSARACARGCSASRRSPGHQDRRAGRRRVRLRVPAEPEPRAQHQADADNVDGKISSSRRPPSKVSPGWCWS